MIVILKIRVLVFYILCNIWNLFYCRCLFILEFSVLYCSGVVVLKSSFSFNSSVSIVFSMMRAIMPVQRMQVLMLISFFYIRLIAKCIFDLLYPVHIAVLGCHRMVPGIASPCGVHNWADWYRLSAGPPRVRCKRLPWAHHKDSLAPCLSQWQRWCLLFGNR